MTLVIRRKSEVQKLYAKEQEIIAACRATAEYWQRAEQYHGMAEMAF
jgi:hypothetical protein